MQFKAIFNSNMDIVPADSTKQKLLKYFQPGCEETFKVSTGKARSLPQHRRHFARLSKIADNFPESAAGTFWANVLADLSRCQGIDVDLLYKLLEKILDVKSISFVDMPQEDAQVYFTKVDEIIDRWEELLF